MPFPYFDRLSSAQQAVYLKSEQVRAIRLPPPEAAALRPVVEQLREALGRGEAVAVQALAQAVCDGLSRALGVASPELELLDVRPRGRGAELHGLYTQVEGERPVIRVWMRTARKGQVVAFSTFLRTVLHELVHHFDFAHFGLPVSFHTRGFFTRETSLFHQLVPGAPRRKRVH